MSTVFEFHDGRLDSYSTVVSGQTYRLPASDTILLKSKASREEKQELEWDNPDHVRMEDKGAGKKIELPRVDLALAKDVSFAERVKMRLRVDALNVQNRAQYGAPNSDFSQVTFGEITSTISSYATGRGTPREFQLSAKISF
ncbi:MAG TPA: hypothetical protein VML19_21885 [Verrucomicrobiae bacterium]|nr:hypothetical protein [Verrucomicrobiae bacterium]